MQILKHRTFHQWAKSEKIKDIDLVKAVQEMEQGLVDGDLGGGLYKKRVARKGMGKRGSYRTLLAFKRDNMAVFVYGFAKKDLGNISPKAKAIYKKLAKFLLGLTAKELKNLVNKNELMEVKL